MRARRPGLPLRAELDPSDDTGQPVAQHLERRDIGSHEPVNGLRVGLAACGPARPVEEDPHRGLPGFDLRILAVLQHLDPRDHTFGEGLPDLLLDAIGHCPVHAILRQWPVIPGSPLTTVMRVSGGGE